MIVKKMTLGEYQEYQEDYDGLCTSCGEIRWGGTEPDAEGYPCDECGQSAVIGIATALTAGHIEIVEESRQ